MGLRSTDQHLTVFVSTAATAYTAVPGTPGSATTALGPAGTITYQSNTGKNYELVDDVLAEAGGDGVSFSIVYHALDGEVYRRGPFLLSDKVQPITDKAYTAPVEQIDTLTIPATIVTGDEYLLRLAVPNYAGMISQQDEVYFYGNHVAVAGDTATLVAAGLHSTLKKSLDSVPTLFADATVATDTITVTGLAQPYIRAKFDGKQVNFHLTLASPATLLADRTTSNIDGVLPAKTVGYGTYAQVAGMEEMYAGYNSDYINRDANFPGNGSPTFAASLGSTYGSSVFTFNSRHDAGSQIGQQRLIVACYFQQ